MKGVQSSRYSLLEKSGDFLVTDVEERKVCGGRMRAIYGFALAGFLCSAVHNMVYSIFSISMISIAEEYGFTWAQRGFILSAFSITYAIFQVPSGLFVSKYGPYIGPFIASFGSFLSLVLIPVLTQCFKDEEKEIVMYIFYCNMLFLGFLGAAFNSALHDIIAHKVDVSRRSFIHNLVYSGQKLGAVMSTLGVNISIDAFGWRVTYVIAGFFCGFVSLMWLFLVDRKMPNANVFVPSNENGHIDEEARQTVEAFTTHEKWWAVAKSPAFMVICLNHFGSVWLSRVVANWGPTFLHLHEGIAFEDLGYLAAIPALLGFFVVAGSGSLMHFLIHKRFWTVLRVRKFVQTIGLGVPALMLIWMNYESSKEIIISLLLLSIALTGLTFGGYHCNHIDIAPEPSMASLMYSVTNTIGQLPGVIEPLIDGFILGATGEPSKRIRNPSTAAWSTVWYIVSALCVLCILLWQKYCRAVPLLVQRTRETTKALD